MTGKHHLPFMHRQGETVTEVPPTDPTVPTTDPTVTNPAFDPNSGQSFASEGWKFDPVTGKSLTDEESTAAFDVTTGQPVTTSTPTEPLPDASAAEGDTFTTSTGVVVYQVGGKLYSQNSHGSVVTVDGIDYATANAIATLFAL